MKNFLLKSNNFYLLFWLPVILLLSPFLFQSCSVPDVSENLSYVDPNIGGVSHLLKPTYPTIHRPNQLIRMIPGRRDYLDDQIRYFPLQVTSHRSAGIMHMLPVSGNPDWETEPVSAWDQQHESVTPYFYQVWLEDYDLSVEFTPGKKSGYFKFTYPADKARHLFLKGMSDGYWQIHPDGSLTAVEPFDGVSAYMYGEFNMKGSMKRSGSDHGHTHSWITFRDDDPGTIEFRYAISYIDTEQARRNLENEISSWDFNQVKDEALQSWRNVMNKIEVKGGTPAHRRSFYTALYRSYERMVDITEEGRYYSHFDGSVHTDERTFYVDDWVWDTYLALHPLRYILDPALEADMIASYLRMYEQSGWLPNFPQVSGDRPAMNGFHSSIMILDAWKKGIRRFDKHLAYEAMKNNALNGTMLPWRDGPKCELDDFYHSNGFYPALHPGETEPYKEVHRFEKRQAVAVTLGHCYDDWALSQMAAELGLKEDHAFFKNRAGWYKNLYWKEKGFFMPKDADGNWIDIDPKFDGGPGGRDYYDENNGWTYLWAVQHDLDGLIELMGGKSSFEARLDQLFREDLGRSKFALYSKFPDFTGIVGQYSMGNEPGFHVPYLYNLTNSPWKTQKKIRMLLDTWFKDNIFGIPGDEDGGGMSAFVVFSAMGFYPLTPGIPVYTIGSPLFTEVTLHLPDGNTFVVSAPDCSERNKYIQQASLNGKELDTPWFLHEELMKGGVLELRMGPFPNKEWGLGKGH